MATITNLSELGFVSLKRIKLKDKKDIAGIYAVVNKKTFEVYYIGSSIHVLKRLKEHAFSDRYCFFIKPVFKDRIEIEKKLISKFNPYLNRRYETLTNYKDIEAFKKWITQFQLSDRTINIYIEVVGLFLWKRHGKKISEETINRFLKKYPRNYVRSGLKKFLKFKGLKLDIAKVKEPVRKPIDVPNWIELKRAIQSVKNKDISWILRLLLITGGRISEILKLKLEDVDFTTNTLLLRTKGNKYRKAKLPSDVAKEFKNYVVEVCEKKGLFPKEKIFFTNYKLLKHAYIELRKGINNLDERNRILFMKTHNFRRAIINKIIDETNGNVAMAKAFIGHENIGTTMRYLSEAEEQKMKERANKLLGLD